MNTPIMVADAQKAYDDAMEAGDYDDDDLE
jgi:hypothetical protein